MQTRVSVGRANYEPNSLAQAGEPGGPRPIAAGVRAFAKTLDGHKARIRSQTFADHYSQARLFYRSQSSTEQGHMVAAMVFELSKVTLAHVRERMLFNLQNVDADLARRVATGLGVAKLPPASPAAAPAIDMKPSPALRLIDKYPATLQGRCIAILVADGSDAAAVARTKKAAQDAGASVKIVAPKIEGAKLSDGKMAAADGQLAGSPSVIFDAVAVILSKDGCAALLKDSAAIGFASDAFVHLKAIGYSADAWPLLEKANVTKDTRIVAIGASSGEFAKAAAGRQWDREPKVRPAL